MWLDVKLFVAPIKGSRRFDLLVSRGRKVKRVTDCYYHRGAQAWFSDGYAKDGSSALRSKDVPLYYMAEPDYPPHLDDHRRK